MVRVSLEAGELVGESPALQVEGGCWGRTRMEEEKEEEEEEEEEEEGEGGGRRRRKRRRKRRRRRRRTVEERGGLCVETLTRLKCVTS